MKKRKCYRCEQQRTEEEFPFKNKKAGIRRTICKTCRNEWGRKWYDGNKTNRVAQIRTRKDQILLERNIVILEYLKVHPCIDCGEDDPIVLEFDHRCDKLFSVSQHIREGYSLEHLLIEIAKCDIRCANCHRRKTAKDRDYIRWRLIYGSMV